MIRKLSTVILIIALSCCAAALSGCSLQTAEAKTTLPEPEHLKSFDDLEVTGKMELSYAKQFGVDYLSDGCSLITLHDGARFLLVPEGQEPPAQVDKSITVLRQPIKNVYLAATAVMCLFDALDSLDTINMSGTKAEGWYIENARKAMERGEIIFAGKYSAPDYEMIVSKKCSLAIENTMIYHSPDVKDKLEAMGIPVLVELSSFETHPLGRTEWIKLYGLLTGKNELAKDLFVKQVAYLEEIHAKNTGKTVAFFYVSSVGNAVVRKSGDYVTKMIELAGGNYIFSNIGDDTAKGSINMNMERFYANAKDADFIIYNSSIDGEVKTLDELIGKCNLLANFKAVKNGNVWCTNKNLFQETTEFGQMISDMHRIFTGDLDDADKLNFLYRIQ